MLSLILVLTFLLRFNFAFSTSHEEQEAFLQWRQEFGVTYDDNETETVKF
jgi:hypothetical protein